MPRKARHRGGAPSEWGPRPCSACYPDPSSLASRTWDPSGNPSNSCYQKASSGRGHAFGPLLLDTECSESTIKPCKFDLSTQPRKLHPHPRHTHGSQAPRETREKDSVNDLPNPSLHGTVLEALSPMPRKEAMRNSSKELRCPKIWGTLLPVFLSIHCPLTDPYRPTGKLLKPTEKFK